MVPGKTITDEIYQGIHQVRDENHQKVEDAVTDEDVYGWGQPRISKILPSAPQRQNEDAGVRYQRRNPERGFSQFLSLFEKKSCTYQYSRKIGLVPANMQPWSSEQVGKAVRWIQTLPTRMGGSGTPVLIC